MGRGRKKSSESKSEVIHVRVDEKLAKSLESFCEASGMSKSEGIRIIIESVLK